MPIQYKIKNDTGKTIQCVDFDGVYDQLKFISPLFTHDPYGVVQEITEQDEWGGTHTFSETVDGMSLGFQNITDYFTNILVERKASTESNLGIKMDVEGFTYDMGAVIAGEPECCLNYGAPSVTPCVKIMLDISNNCGIKPEMIYNRSIAVVNLINTLLLSGVIVELYVFLYNMQLDMDIMYTVKIDTDILSIANIAFISSVEYFRKIGFITIDAIRKKSSLAGRGRGEIHGFILNKLKRDKIFFIGGSYSDANFEEQYKTINNANEYILKIFNKFCEENKLSILLKNNKQNGNT